MSSYNQIGWGCG